MKGMEDFWRWMDGDVELYDGFDEIARERDDSREKVKARIKELDKEIDASEDTQRAIRVSEKTFALVYRVVSVICCLVLTGTLLYAVAHLPYFGKENPRVVEVMKRYSEKGLEETGAVNIVSGMILDYRAFDTLGESHVLFTALVCVMILLRKDKKNMRRGYEDYFTIGSDQYYGIDRDNIIHRIGYVLVPCIFLYGFYILLNGQNSPGGGFSGGAVLGAGMIIFASAFGFQKADTFFTARFCSLVTLSALAFYSFAKGYVFFTGANGIENGIPKGVPGAILSGGLILPLNIAVGIVVACTMYGFYSLFRRGSIGSSKEGGK